MDMSVHDAILYADNRRTMLGSVDRDDVMSVFWDSWDRHFPDVHPQDAEVRDLIRFGERCLDGYMRAMMRRVPGGIVGVGLSGTLRLSDLDTKTWIFTIRHVKGEDTYGSKRSVPVLEEVRPVVLNYLSVREQWLASAGYSTKALFFGTQGDHGHLSGNSFRKIKSKVEAAIDEKFELRDCRRAFGQTYLDKGLETESASVFMGHSTTKTTELYYCRVNESDAIRRARDVW